MIDDCMNLPVKRFLEYLESSEHATTAVAPAITGSIVLNNLALCDVNDSLKEIFIKFSETQVQRLLCVDGNGKLQGKMLTQPAYRMLCFYRTRFAL